MRFLVHASGDRMFGFATQAAATAPPHSPLTAAARTALLDALAVPVTALDGRGRGPREGRHAFCSSYSGAKG
eukprot:5843668-Pleurochrysis_carterae.AAC.1